MNKREIIKQEYKALQDELKALSSSDYEKEEERQIKRSTECIYCDSKSIEEHYTNVNGEVDGSMSGNWSLFGGSMHGSVHGETQTDKVFRCTKCKKAWKEEELDYKTSKDMLESFLSRMRMWVLHREDVEFDPENPKEEFESEEAKQEDQVKHYKKAYFDPYNPLRKCHPETIKWAIENEYWGRYSSEERMLEWSDEMFYEFGCQKWPNTQKSVLRKKDWSFYIIFGLFLFVVLVLSILNL